MDRSAIIFLKNKHSDKLEYAPNVRSIEHRGKLYHITFDSGKWYSYSAENVRIYPLKRTHRSVRLYLGARLIGAYEALDDYGAYLIGRYTDGQTPPMERHRRMEICPITTDTARAQQLLDYYRCVLEQGLEPPHDLPSDEESRSPADRETLTAIQLSVLERIDLSDSRPALQHYIAGTLPLPTTLSEPPLFPFGCNESQKRALETALSHTISVIEGPPGTGKTQTILNIIANLVAAGKTVAVVSNNNTAVFNVRDKLTRYGYGALVASLGNKENRATFFEAPPQMSLPDGATLDRAALRAERAEVKRLVALLSESFASRRALATLRAELQDAEVEHRHLLEEQPLEPRVYAEIDQKFRRKLSHKRVLHLRSLLEQAGERGGRLSWRDRLRLAVSFGLLEQRILRERREEVMVYLNHKFYDLYLAHLRAEIAAKETYLEAHNERELITELTERSRRLLDALLLAQYEPAPQGTFTLDNYKQQFEVFIRHYPIVTSSTLSLPLCIPRGFLFDYLIIDEASQVDSIKGVMSLACCRRAVIVGDSMQLAPIVDEASRCAADEAFLAADLPKPYDYTSYSILTSLKALLGDALPCVLLREHYRCHPAIIGYCNKKYYGGQLVVMTEGGGRPFKVIETNIADGNHGYSQRQIDETDLYIRSYLTESNLSVGVITPYREQAERLQAQLPPEIEADTIHRYQGREKDVIIFNTVRPRISEFMDNPHLINVAVSRAVHEFIIVKPAGMELPYGSNVGDLVRYMMYCAPEGCEVIEGRLRSVFDILYRALGEERTIVRDMYAAEERVCRLLRDEVLPSSPQLGCLTFAREYSLRDLVRDCSGLSDDEVQYIRNNARLDFLIYSTIDKAPILAIEVDGVGFHATAAQEARDRMKDRILSALGLPFVRLSTNGHSEGERIRAALLKTLGDSAVSAH